MDLDIPELEDFSDIIKISKDKNQVFKSENSIRNQSDDNDGKVTNKTDFGGLKKGFLANGLSEKKCKKNDGIPFLKANPDKAKENLIFKEIQDKNNKSNWLTNDLLNEVSEDTQLTAWLSDPRTAVILSDFEHNPQAAILKYKDDKETQSMLLKFGHLLGGHFSKSISTDNPNKTKPNEVIISGYDPSKPPAIKSSLDNQVDKALATDGVRDALLDRDIQKIINCLRSDPNEAQRLIKEADRQTHQKLRLLIESGVLGMQQ